MRPRHKAAENLHRAGVVAHRQPGASMRPRHKAAENAAGAPAGMGDGPASMRPRHKAAENNLTAVPNVSGDTRFNEAAA